MPPKRRPPPSRRSTRPSKVSRRAAEAAAAPAPPRPASPSLSPPPPSPSPPPPPSTVRAPRIARLLFTPRRRSTSFRALEEPFLTPPASQPYPQPPNPLAPALPSTTSPPPPPSAATGSGPSRSAGTGSAPRHRPRPSAGAGSAPIPIEEEDTTEELDEEAHQRSPDRQEQGRVHRVGGLDRQEMAAVAADIMAPRRRTEAATGQRRRRSPSPLAVVSQLRYRVLLRLVEGREQRGADTLASVDSFSYAQARSWARDTAMMGDLVVANEHAVITQATFERCPVADRAQQSVRNEVDYQKLVDQLQLWSNAGKRGLTVILAFPAKRPAVADDAAAAAPAATAAAEPIRRTVTTRQLDGLPVVVEHELNRNNHMPLLLQRWICKDRYCRNLDKSCWINGANLTRHHYPISPDNALRWAEAIAGSRATINDPLVSIIPAMALALANRRVSTAIPALPTSSSTTSGGTGHQTFNIHYAPPPPPPYTAIDLTSSPPTEATDTADEELWRLFFADLRAHPRWQRALSPLRAAEELLVEHQYDLRSFKAIKLRHWSEDWHLPEGIKARLDTEVSKWLRKRNR
ncbi:hypothetical protein MBLNU457_1918t1 [Dothideomycetes sp. NU457]